MARSGLERPSAGGGQPRRRKQDLPRARRLVAWVSWWVLLMGLWLWIDDSLLLSEIIAGAVAAGLGATVAELAQYQAATHLRLRSEWLGRVPRLCLQVVTDTFKLLVVLWRRLGGLEPPSGFREEAVIFGDDSPAADTRRALILGARSIAPNTLALGIERESDMLVVHQLVLAEEKFRRDPRGKR